MTVTLPAAGQLVGLVGVIVFLPTVAPQLTRDRALVATDDGGDLRLVMCGFHQSVYLVSLFAGKLRIVHCVLL